MRRPEVTGTAFATNTPEDLWKECHPEETIMPFSDDRNHLRIELRTRGCEVPQDERERMQRFFEPLAEVARDFPEAALELTCLYHKDSGTYRAEARLRLPGRTLFSSDGDPYLDSAVQRCLDKITHKAEAYRDAPDRGAVNAAQRREALDRDLVAPRDPDTGPLGRAVAQGDYRAFRNALAGYEDWLRTRAGRWLQRYPQAEARVGSDLLIGDLVEEIYLNAFETYERWPRDVPFHDWLGSLLDPSVKEFLRHPYEARTNASMVRSLREAPLGGA
jgi:hypothetical protein